MAASVAFVNLSAEERNLSLKQMIRAKYPEQPGEYECFLAFAMDYFGLSLTKVENLAHSLNTIEELREFVADFSRHFEATVRYI
jgi:hypothetical protein